VLTFPAIGAAGVVGAIAPAFFNHGRSPSAQQHEATREDVLLQPMSVGARA